MYNPADLIDIKRQLNNIIRQGTIYAIDGDRVQVQSSQLITNWLPWFTRRAGNAKTWWQPSVGEQVFILSPNGNIELGCVLPGIYSDENPSPSTAPNITQITMPDGATFTYDHNASALTIDAIQAITINTNSAIIDAKTVEVTAPEVTIDSTVINLTAPTVNCSGHVNMASFSAGSSARSSANAGTITGSLIQTNGVISSNGIILDTHVHDYKDGTTSTPK